MENPASALKGVYKASSKSHRNSKDSVRGFYSPRKNPA